MPGQGFYLYGFARANVLRHGSPLGLDEYTPVATREQGTIAAVVSAIDLADFQGEAAEENLHNPHWLVPRACHHERVVEQIMAASPVLPARFGSVFSSAEALAGFLRAHSDAIGHFLESISGKEEWSVKAFVEKERAIQAVIDTNSELAEQRRRLPLSPGTRYFREKQLLAAAHKRLHSWSANFAARIEKELRPLAIDANCSRPRGTHPALPGADLVLNLALLLSGDAVGALRDRIEALADTHRSQGLILECSGPWPPYNFCPALGEATS